MGILRYLLSLLVLLSHLGISILGLNPGVVAVVVFYLLAGHVVQGLLDSKAGSVGLTRAFYIDRLWRILPLYLVALLCSGVLWWCGATSPFLNDSPDLQDWLANLTIIPLNFYMYTGQDSFTLVPPAWSLGAELQFYLLVPLLWFLSLRVSLGVFCLSLLVFAMAQWGVLDTDYFGYRLLPGLLFVYMQGMYLRQGADKGAESIVLTRLLLWLWLVMVAYLVVLWATATHRPYDVEVVVGLVFGVPLLRILSQIELAGWLRGINRQAGSVAYGVFLLHFPAIWLVQLLGVVGNQALWVVIITTIAAWVAHQLLERPLWKCFRPIWLPGR